MAGQYGGQPIIIDPRKQSTKGKDALAMNIKAAKIVADIVKTTLGPKGMDKMLVNAVGDIVITNDGAMILKGMEIEHPTAKMIVEVARTQEDIAGDGTTSAVVLAGALLEQAEDLIDDGVHPSVIINGFRDATERSLEVLEDFAMDVTENDREILEEIAKTAIAGKSSEAFSDLLAELCIDAILKVQKDGKVNVNDDILLRQDPGTSISETEFVEGVMIPKSAVHSAMPRQITNAKIALLDAPLEVRKTANKSKLQIHSSEQLEAFLQQEKDDLKKTVETIIATGANVVFVSKNIDDKAADMLQKKGILAIKRTNDDDMKHLSYTTGARLVRKINEMTEKELGSAGSVEQKGEFALAKTYIKDCASARTVTIMLRGGTEHVTDNLERTIDDVLHVVKAVFEDEKIVAGGGAAEIEIAQNLRSYASSAQGREQLAISAFADAIENIPRAIADNAGMDGTDILLQLRAEHSENKNIGLDVYTGETVDMIAKGIVDPLRVKTQAIRSASEVTNMILRVDNMLRAERKEMMDVNPEHNIHNYNGI
ncbi:MAG: thermosome subunit alpha [Euryarchaeota archaeon]|nr:thermosome subunit alpha [Euryarchaeota archaeon]